MLKILPKWVQNSGIVTDMAQNFCPKWAHKDQFLAENAGKMGPDLVRTGKKLTHQSFAFAKVSS